MLRSSRAGRDYLLAAAQFVPVVDGRHRAANDMRGRSRGETPTQRVGKPALSYRLLACAETLVFSSDPAPRQHLAAAGAQRRFSGRSVNSAVGQPGEGGTRGHAGELSGDAGQGGGLA